MSDEKETKATVAPNSGGAGGDWIPYVALLAVTSAVVVFLTNRGEEKPGPADAAEPEAVAASAPAVSPSPAPVLAKVAASAPGATVDEAQLRRGETLSKAVCATCHVYPEPGIETKFSWSMEILPRMAVWLGFGGVEFDSEKGGDRVKEAGLIPDQEAMPLEDWEAICNYYLHNAPAKSVPQPARPEITVGIPHFQAVLPQYDRPAQTTLVKIAEGHKRIYLGNDQEDTLELFQLDGSIGGSMTFPGPPVAVHETDEGLNVTLIGNFEPSDLLEGAIVRLGKPKDGKPGQTSVLVQELARPTDAVFVDLNGDKREDILIPEFGYNLGQLTWFENLGNERYGTRTLFEHAGAIRALTYDFNRDGKLDIIALVGQAREGIYLFTNQGDNQFDMEPVALMHPSWGHSDMTLGDFNADGHIDILATNGDNGDRYTYRHDFKPYHGVRIYLNDGKNNFAEGWFFPMNGAYRALARDFDGDGDLDMAATSYFPDWVRSPAEAFVYFENTGEMKFKPYTFPEAVSGKWLVMDAADIEGDGDIDIVLGAYNLGPGVVPPNIQEEWDRVNAPFAILENTSR